MTVSALEIEKEDEVLFHIKNGIGTITLNRPKALNALSLNMIRELWKILSLWKTDPHVRVVVLGGAGEKAFCAGGDIRAVYDAGKAQQFDICDAFFREEYTLNCLIRSYPKPYISMIQGIAMGGGLGVSVNGKYRVLSESVMIAMPETGIGFFPDVGGTTFLSQAPGKVGLYLALTGARLNSADALYAGLGTHHIPKEKWEEFKKRLESKNVDELLGQYALPLTGSQLEHDRTEIDLHFSKESVEEVVKSLESSTTSFAEKAYEILKTKSPLSVKIAFHQMNARDKNANFPELMQREFRISQHLMHSHDFYEGVRAVLVDKDQAPKWNPVSFDDVTPEIIRNYFSPLGEKELTV